MSDQTFTQLLLFALLVIVIFPFIAAGISIFLGVVAVRNDRVRSRGVYLIVLPIITLAWVVVCEFVAQTWYEIGISKPNVAAFTVVSFFILCSLTSYCASIAGKACQTQKLATISIALNVITLVEILIVLSDITYVRLGKILNALNHITQL